MLPHSMVALTTSSAIAAAVVVVGCGGDVHRREFGDQDIPSPDTLANVGQDGDEDEDEDDDGAGEGPLDPQDDPDGGPLDDDGMADDAGDDADGIDDGIDDGVDDGVDGAPLDDDGGDTGPPESPYIGGWDIGTCQNDVVSTGTNVGQVMPDFNLLDANGDTVRLYDFCHKAVWLISGAFW